jgi:hypothetical protein
MLQTLYVGCNYSARESRKKMSLDEPLRYPSVWFENN